MKTELSWFLRNPSSRLLAQLIRNHDNLDKDAQVYMKLFLSQLTLFVISTIILCICYPVVGFFYCLIFIPWRWVSNQNFLKIVQALSLENSKRQSRLLITLDQCLFSLQQAKVSSNQGFLRTDFMQASNAYQQSHSHLYNFTFRWIKWKLLQSDFMNMVFVLLASVGMAQAWDSLFLWTNLGARSLITLGIAYTVHMNTSFSLFWESYNGLVTSIVCIASLIEFSQHTELEEEGFVEKIENENSPILSLDSLSFQNKSTSESTLNFVQNNTIHINGSQQIAIFSETFEDKLNFFNFIAGLENFSRQFSSQGVKFFGHEFEDWNKPALRTFIYVLESLPFNFNGTVSNNIDPYNEYSTKKKLQVLSYLEIYDLATQKVIRQRSTSRNPINNLSSEFQEFVARLKKLSEEKNIDKNESRNSLSQAFFSTSSKKVILKAKKIMPVAPSENNKNSIERKLEVGKIKRKDDEFIELEKLNHESIKGEKPESTLRGHQFSHKEAALIEKIMDQKILGFGGQNVPLSFRRLFALARVLLVRPKILLIREESLETGLHPQTYYLNLLKINLPETLIFAFPNNLDNVEYFDQILVLKEGRVQEIGQATQLIVGDGNCFTEMMTSLSLGELNSAKLRLRKAQSIT